MSRHTFENVFSTARLSTYHKATGGDWSKSKLLYLWNAEISGAFIPILQTLEVAIRNAITEALEQIYGVNWAWHKTFELSLPNNKDQRKPWVEKSTKYRNDTGKIIADMNFIFWQKMFTRRFSNNIWNTHLHNVFPNVGATSIQTLYAELDQIRKLRNRIAHHEPIFNRNLADDLNLILKVIGYRNHDIRDWISNAETVTAILARKPN